MADAAGGGGAAEMAAFVERYPETRMLEVLLPDMNGILRCKRIHRREFEALAAGTLKVPGTTQLVSTMGDIADDVLQAPHAGDPDLRVQMVPGSLAQVPWLESPTGQVLARLEELEGGPAWMDPRSVLEGVLARFGQLGLRPVVATEMEFYLVEPGEGDVPRPLLGSIPGTGQRQQGIQYAMSEDLWERDAFLEDVRLACEAQGVPLTTIHCEFAPGQWEINTRHVDDPVAACDQALLLRRIVRGTALRRGLSATFMAKPFAGIDGSGMHIHASLYDEQGRNVFAQPESDAHPPISAAFRHAIGGLADTMGDAMAIFAPNANSFRRFVPGAYAPLAPCWSYNHRDVSLRIPESGHSDRRIEHRVAGADANPLLVVAAVLAGMHHGLVNECDPGPMVPEGAELGQAQASLPNRWEDALDRFSRSRVMREYLGERYFEAFSIMRRHECDAYHATIPSLDYQWYLRAI